MAYEIRFQNPSSLEKLELNKTEIFIKNGELNFDNVLNEQVEIFIHNLSGNLIYNAKTHKSYEDISILRIENFEFVIMTIIYSKTKVNKKIKLLNIIGNS
ncbi:MAG: hypothetical protein EAZ27_02385 [Cytophagales bacterium]|nr:MAG: hypothetical protein EAZ27_02385 [Cytophagales bacterium]